eukprot:CAMPEP_0172157480 /NCGR_PEP_ID=MMETSP1050-20130122/3811_1 /TAXON_ID=233186 /ORGANISM="Cryptomonas curvata, Strain CCAP979/52" /LENGTH=207 /DNA_ID=CAMNT_0012826707 /DNA_START=165 /DNA_END=784 /DNA_ORIENTATION=-
MAVSRACELHIKLAIICLFSYDFFLKSEATSGSSESHAAPLFKCSSPKRTSVLSRLTLRGGDDGNLKESSTNEGPTSADITKIKKIREKSMTRSSRAGLQFPVGRLARFLKDKNAGKRIAGGAPVYLAAVLEYLTAEVLELAGNAARDNNKLRIIPRHILLAVRSDEELDRLLSHVTISDGGVLPNVLVPKDGADPARPAKASKPKS